MHPNAPYFIILLCLTPDDFARQEESASTQWINQIDYLPMYLVNPLVAMHLDAPCFIILLCLTPDDCIRQWQSAAAQMG
jgi:cytosine/uracil/thiamine/allantoin permease